MKHLSFPKPLSKEETKTYFQLMQDGNEDAYNKLIEHNLRLVVYIVQKFENTKEDSEDLVSIGIFGLIKAVKTFDVNRQINFSTYAIPCIKNEILMSFRKKQIKKISLEEIIHVNSDEDALTLLETLSDDSNIEEDCIKEELFIEIKKALDTLNEVERQIIILYFVESLTQHQIGEKLGITQNRVSQRIKDIIMKMKSYLEKKDLIAQAEIKKQKKRKKTNVKTTIRNEIAYIDTDVSTIAINDIEGGGIQLSLTKKLK